MKPLDPVLHSQLRLAVVSLLMTVEEAEFTWLKDKTESTAGNLSVQLEKLKQAGYISIEKTYRDKYPLTRCRITQEGINAFEAYVQDLKSYLEPKRMTG